MAQNPNDIPKVDRYINPRRVPQKQTVRIFSTDPRASNKKFLSKNNVIIIDKGEEEIHVTDASYVSSRNNESDSSTYVAPNPISAGVNDAPQIIGVTFDSYKTQDGKIAFHAYLLLPDSRDVVKYEVVSCAPLGGNKKK